MCNSRLARLGNFCDIPRRFRQLYLTHLAQSRFAVSDPFSGPHRLPKNMLMDHKGQYLDLSAEAPSPRRAGDGAKSFLGVHFTCCDVYCRIYPNRDLTDYVGHCPRCAKRVTFKIGPGGTEARFFSAG